MCNWCRVGRTRRVSRRDLRYVERHRGVRLSPATILTRSAMLPSDLVRLSAPAGCNADVRPGCRATSVIGAPPGDRFSARFRIRWPVSLPPHPSRASRSPSSRERTVSPLEIARDEPGSPIGRCFSFRARNKASTFAVLSSAPFTTHSLRYSVTRPASGGWRLTNRTGPCRVVTSIMS